MAIITRRPRLLPEVPGESGPRFVIETIVEDDGSTPPAAPESDAGPPPQPRERSIVLHVGAHKTGTTAIQYHFWKNDSDLARWGILYPKAGRPVGRNEYGHHEIPWALLGEGVESADAVLARLRAEIAQSDAPTIILSSEEFDRVRQPIIERLAAALELPVKVILYYRRQSAILEGIYGTSVVHSGERRNIAEFRQTYDGALDFLVFARRWAEVFGKDAVLARAYDPRRFPDGNIVPDFLGALGLAGPLPVAGEKVVYNRSLPWFAILSVLKLRRQVVPEPVIEQVVNALEIVFRDGAPSGGLLSPSQARALDLEFAESNALFHAEFCPDQPPITPHSGEGEDEFYETHAGLWPDVAPTLAAVAAFIARYGEGGDA